MAVISSPASASASFLRGGWRHLDWLLLALVMVLSVWGCLTIYSATRSAREAFVSNPTASNSIARDGSAATASSPKPSALRPEPSKQALSIALGIIAIILMLAVDYQWLMYLQGWIYTFNVALLGLLLVLPRTLAPLTNGAKSWIHAGPLTLQPSEFCKVAVIVTLAAFLCRRQEKIIEWKTVVKSLLYLALPLLLILKQPDFGTMLSVLSIWFGMLFFGGARWQHLLAVTLIGITLFGAVWKMDLLKEHQKERLAVFLETNPSTRSARDEGYQIKQSQIAIGGGRISGQGFGQGIQSHSGYMPENTTDFVFTVVAEELGFVGAGTLLVLYLLLLLRSANLAVTTDNYFGVLIAGGFTTLLAFHAVVNLGMTMRVMPITGVPLPFFSYGGSSYISFALCVGLLQNIALHSRRNVAA
jgi:rod shape determining protein RodA